VRRPFAQDVCCDVLDFELRRVFRIIAYRAASATFHWRSYVLANPTFFPIARWGLQALSRVQAQRYLLFEFDFELPIRSFEAPSEESQ